jgi:hypothetical protein
MEEKFRWLAGHVLDQLRVDRVAEMLWQFDQIAHVRELVQLLS